MERVTFLVEESNERLSCMLNPETVLMKRSTGVRPRESLSGIISASGKGDNPLLFTGAGHTTIELDLVFDTSYAGSSISSNDVRDLTRPIWDLSENQQRDDRLFRPALCRFIWGKSWNIPGVISAIAEKLESFSAEGVPHRSWIRLELIRMREQPHSAFNENNLWSTQENTTTPDFTGDFPTTNLANNSTAPTSNSFDTVSNTLENSFERIDLTAERLKGDPSLWRDISVELNLENPLQWAKEQIEEHLATPEQQEPTQ